MKDGEAPVWTFGEVERRLRAAVTTRQRQQTATADQIREMNECFSKWLPMITDLKYRNVVYVRSFTREKTGTPVVSWPILASKMYASASACKLWYKAGINTIVSGLSGK